MAKGKQKRERSSAPLENHRAQGARTPSVDPAFNGELPHGTKKVSLGPNTKR